MQTIIKYFELNEKPTLPETVILWIFFLSSFAISCRRKNWWNLLGILFSSCFGRLCFAFTSLFNNSHNFFWDFLVKLALFAKLTVWREHIWLQAALQRSFRLSCLFLSRDQNNFFWRLWYSLWSFILESACNDEVPVCWVRGWWGVLSCVLLFFLGWRVRKSFLGREGKILNPNHTQSLMLLTSENQGP